MRHGARRRSGEGRRVSRWSRQAFWILRRRGDEGDGREGKSQSDQRHPARETRRLRNRGLLCRIYFVLDAAWCRRADAECLHAVEPGVFALGRGCEGRRSMQRDRAIRTHLRASTIGHVDVFAVVRLQHEAHVDHADTVGADQEPVAAAGQNLALEARAFEFAAAHVNDAARSLGRIWNYYWRSDPALNLEKQFVFHLDFLVDLERLAIEITPWASRAF